MSRLNILNKEGLLSKQDCKEPLIHGCQHRLSQHALTYLVSPKFRHMELVVRYPYNYAATLHYFIDWWVYFVKSILNGFSGHSATKVYINWILSLQQIGWMINNL
jgi:hypothetical protein